MLKVADLFCGAGGISEGLRMAGFEIVFGLDKDKSAVETFSNNHPGANVINADISKINIDDIPYFDVLVGGPPCVNFSTSKGNRANVLDGLKLVQEFLKIVYLRKPKYWIMENVPRIALHLPEKIPLKWIGINKTGYLEVSTKNEFDASLFGVPQRRKRLLLGNYSLPIETHYKTKSISNLFNNNQGQKECLTLGDTINSLSKNNKGFVNDPIYDLKIESKNFTDHNIIIMEGSELEKIRRAKVEHPYMGKMKFPDDLSVPSRTVVATQMGRETIVIQDETNRKITYRRPTVRECASLQSFPINYQFYGNSLNIRYRLVGDAVPPKLTYEIGKQIINKKKNSKPKMQEKQIKLSPKCIIHNTRKKKTSFPLMRKYSQSIPGKEIRGMRVSFENKGEKVGFIRHGNENQQHLTEWVTRLYVGEGKNDLRTQDFTFHDALVEFSKYFNSSSSAFSKTESMIIQLKDSYYSKIPDASTLQALWSRKLSVPDIYGPEEIGNGISEIINKYFPANKFNGIKYPRSGHFSVVPEKGLLVRIGASLVATSLITDIINHDTNWIVKNFTDSYSSKEALFKSSCKLTIKNINDPVIMLLDSKNKLPEDNIFYNSKLV